MCDSCIGGKTGINYEGVKNQLALFSAPARVIINTEFLKTLPEREILSGLGEIIKLAITGGKNMVDIFNQEVKRGKVKNFDSFNRLIKMSLAVKKSVVERDEFELNIRKSLNYGHTIGHALESLSHYAIPHGQAVATGTLIVNELAVNRKLLTTAANKKLHSVLISLLSPEIKSIIKKLSLNDLAQLLKKDKKSLSGKAIFILIKNPGDTIFFPVTIDKGLILEIKNIIKKLF
jgi:3-dehydroquinate synthase